MKTTSLYLPFKDFKINEKDGNPFIYKSLIENGPSYKLIVHESESWLSIKEKMPKGDMIEIIEKKDEEKYLDVVNNYFKPIIETIPQGYDINGKRYPPRQLTSDLNRALSYIYIASKYNARILDDDFFNMDMTLSEKLPENVFSEDSINRIKLIENLLSGYKKVNVTTLSSKETFDDYANLMNLLDDELVKKLSGINYAFGLIETKKDELIRDISVIATEIFSTDMFQWIVLAPFVIITLVDAPKYYETLSYFGGLTATLLRGHDFRKYAPPIIPKAIISYIEFDQGLFSLNPFNDHVYISTQTPPKKHFLKIKDALT
jgi:hypothetical protein